MAKKKRHVKQSDKLSIKPASKLRKRDDKALRESEAQLWATLQSTADGILAVDSKGKVLQANQRFVELWRIPQALMERKDDLALLDFVLEQLTDPDAFLKKVQLLYKSDAVDMDTLAFKDGRVFERYSRPMVIGDAVTGRVWSFRDITERKRAEDKIRLLAQTLSSTKDCVSIADFEDRIIFVNDAFLQTYRYTREELVGQPISLVRSTNTFPEIGNQILIGTLAGGWYGEILNRRKDGSDFPVELWTSVVKDESGKVVATVGVAREITERNRAKAEREKLILELQEALAKIKTLSGLIPICANCKKIRDDKGYWNQLEKYIIEHSEAHFTHGICPECATRLHDELEK